MSIVRHCWKHIAGFCLAFFFLGCGIPEYRLEGQVVAQTSEVVLLNGSAAVVLDSLLAVYSTEVDQLQARKTAALDSLSNSTSALNRPIATARRRYNEARAKYREVFKRLERFQSFGGNPIFSTEDAGVSTRKLLAEIADRFYKGRAFSLETEGQIRRYIRQNLVPLERDANQKRSRMVQLQKSQSGKSKGRDKLEREFETLRVGLIDETNRGILEALEKCSVSKAVVDSTLHYRFVNLRPARYHLYVPHPLPQGHLVPIEITGHAYQNLSSDNLKEILLTAADSQ